MCETFDPDHPRYHHAGCCDAHVVTAARAVAIFALIASILRTLFMLEGWWERPQSWEKLKGASSLVEAICISLLLYGVFKDYGLMVLPYVMFQNLIVFQLLYASFLELARQGFPSETTPPQESSMIMIRCIGRVSWTAVSIYFCYVLINYYRFLKQKTAALKDRTSWLTAIHNQQSIHECRLVLEPETPSAQDQALIPQYPKVPLIQVFEPPPPYGHRMMKF